MASHPVEQALSEFIEALNEGRSPNPREFIDRVPDADRAEVEALIEIAIVEGPRREWDPEAFEASPAAAAADRIYESLGALEPETVWPDALVAWRKAARIKRSDLVERLAAKLGVSDKTQKVGAYYHELECGELEPAGVSSRVWSALSSLIGISPDEINRTARTWSLRPPEGGQAVFTRTVGAPAEIAAPAAERQPPEEFDEVDELFLDST